MRGDGFIYIIGSKVGHKIGLASNYKTRFHYIKVASPVELWFEKVFRVRKCQYVEKKLHNLFKEKHIRGEWFKLNKKDLKAIDGFIRYNNYLVYEVDVESDIYQRDNDTYQYQIYEADTTNEIVLQTEINNLRNKIKGLGKENEKLHLKILRLQ